MTNIIDDICDDGPVLSAPLSRDHLGQMVVGRGVGLEVTELLLLLGIQPPLSTSLLWRLVEAAVLVGHLMV